MTEVLEKTVFPIDYRAVCALNQVSAATVKSCKQSIKALETRRYQMDGIVGITYALLTHWSQNDPGKYGLSISFLGQNEHRVLVEEYLPPDIKRFTKEEWEAAPLSERQHGFDPRRKVISLADVLCAECPECHESHPVLEWYRQTYDGPGGDEWLKRHILLCCADVDSPKQIELDRKVSADRF
ncbi:MAG: hypothetical protein AAB472_01110 [Patescibacteria group bacterium]